MEILKIVHFKHFQFILHFLQENLRSLCMKEAFLRFCYIFRYKLAVEGYCELDFTIPIGVLRKYLNVFKLDRAQKCPKPAYLCEFSPCCNCSANLYSLEALSEWCIMISRSHLSNVISHRQTQFVFCSFCMCRKCDTFGMNSCIRCHFHEEYLLYEK